MKRFNKLFGCCDRYMLEKQRHYSIKRKFPINREEANDLPIFKYPLAKSVDRRVYVFGLAETGALGIKVPERSESARNKNKIRSVEIPKRIFFGENHDVTEIASGYGFSAFAVKTSDCNKVFGTGLNTDSQIGYHAPRRHNPLEIILYPAPISLPLKQPQTTKVINLSAGRAHLVIVTDNEGIYTLGNNAYGQCGRKINPDENYKGSMIINKIDAFNGEKIIKAQCGQDHSMFLSESGNVYACGWGCDGQLGRGDLKTDSEIRLVTGDIENEKIVKLSCTADCILALSENGDVFGWGNTEYGQLNHGESHLQQMNTSRYLNVCKGFGKIVDIAAGGSFCLILNENGDVFSWGYGLLGKGPEVKQSFVPLQIPNTLFGRNEFNPGTVVTSVMCGMSHMAAITDRGDLFTWGKNKHGCLGLGQEKDQYFPLKSAIGARVLKVACGIDHTVALCKPFV